jgi:3-dehydroquinate dehydratase-2
MARIAVIHGPNLNMLGKREPGIYGDMDFERMNDAISHKGRELGHIVQIHQSNHEGKLVDIIQGLAGEVDLIVINPGAYTHTSVAIRDALLAAGTPVIEAHISNIHSREPFRRKSFISDIAVGVITGFGVESYMLALHAASAVCGGGK